jgi:lysophospholipase L1-like esterase
MNFCSKVWQSVVVASMVLTPMVWAKVTIYMCGDSTMQDWWESAYPKQGMGQDFHFFFNSSEVEVYNAGRGGTTSQTFYEGHWLVDFVKKGVTYPAISGLIKNGDYVLIMFGANDNGYKTGEANFRRSVGGMVTEARAKGANPILLTPIRRSNFTNADSVYESYHEYPIFMRRVADSLRVPLIDLDTLSRNYLLTKGEYYSHHYVNMFIDEGEYSTSDVQTDNQHLQQMGANAMGRIVTEQLRIHSDATVKKLANYLVPMYQVDVKVSPEGSDSATTVSSYYPQGMTVTLKTTPKAGKTFVGWFDGNGNKVSGNAVTQITSDKMYSFVMGNKSTQFTAVYANGAPVKYTGSGAALTTFPTNVPGCGGPCNTGSTSGHSEEVVTRYDIKGFFDAYAPDEGDGSSMKNHENYSGEGFFDFLNQKNSAASFQMVFPAAGRSTMAIRYSFVSANDRMVNVYLDHDYYVSFKSTGSWDKWDTAYVDIDLLNGENTLQFISMSDDGGPNIDGFGFTTTGVLRKKLDGELVKGAGEPEIPEIVGSMGRSMGGVQLRGDILSIKGSSQADVSIYDMTGRLVAQKRVENAANISLSSMVKPAGLYRVLIRQGSAKYSASWAKVR